MRDDRKTSCQGLDVGIGRGFIEAHVKEQVGATIHFRHPVTRKLHGVESSRHQSVTQCPDFFSLRSLSANHQMKARHQRGGADAFIHPPGFNQGADHQGNWDAFRKVKGFAFCGTGAKHRGINPVGNQPARPLGAVLSEVIGVRADKSIAKEPVVFTGPGVDGVVAVLSDENQGG